MIQLIAGKEVAWCWSYCVRIGVTNHGSRTRHVDGIWYVRCTPRAGSVCPNLTKTSISVLCGLMCLYDDGFVLSFLVLVKNDQKGVWFSIYSHSCDIKLHRMCSTHSYAQLRH